MADPRGAVVGPDGLLPLLREALGPRPPWWTVETPLEVLIGTVLVQNTAWRNVEASLARLRAAGIHTTEDLGSVDADALVDLVRPSGFQTAKARTLVGLSRWWRDRIDMPLDVAPPPDPRPGGRDPVLAAAPLRPDLDTDALRAELLALEAVRSTGGTRFALVRWGLWPQAQPEVLAFWLYRFEISVRSSAILGLIGAGGIGKMLTDNTQYRIWDAVGMLLIVVVAVTMIIDQISGTIRQRIITGRWAFLGWGRRRRAITPGVGPSNTTRPGHVDPGASASTTVGPEIR